LGDPKRSRKQYHSPGHPYQKARIDSELVIVGKYGLRNKRELWKARTRLSNYRSQARGLLALEEEERLNREKILIEKLFHMGIVEENMTTDDILGLEVERILNRRLQTIVLQNGFAGTIHQARQLITHRHIAVDGRVMTSPSANISRSQEGKIGYAPSSPFSDPSHPMNGSLSRESTIIEIPDRPAGGRRR
jgi:small subunit ribosomal protein S4